MHSSGSLIKKKAKDLRYSDEQEALEAKAKNFLVLPFISRESYGYAALFLGKAPSAMLEEPVIRGLAKVIGIAHRNCRLIERVAAVSRRAHVENRELRRQLESLSGTKPIIAKSKSMQEVLQQIEMVSAHTTTVLLRGESGTGKELFAHRIHELSSRSNRPFITVNCGALPETLIESELFGHEKGAFTGASRRYRGRFERAHRGTIFLDEVAELSLAAQVKLLRVLQEGVIEPLGSEEPKKVDVRVIAATHRPLEEMLRRGEFREDLFYRLGVFPVEIPPLRERPEDIPVLVGFLLDEIAKRLGRSPPRVSKQTLKRLLQAAWPGNVRELANVLERASILSRGDELELPPMARIKGISVSVEDRLQPTETFEQAARRCIEGALTASAGRLYGPNGAAKRLNLNPSTLQTKMRKYGIERRDFVATQST